MHTQFSIPVQSYRRLDTPFDARNRINTLAFVDINDLPDLSKWTEVNVRDAKLTGRVPQKIREALVESENFPFMNRGMVISVESIRFDNRDDSVHFVLSDPDLHGLLDGGHTYKVIMENRHDVGFPQFVKIEFLAGFDEGDIASLVEARNTSNQVQDKSIDDFHGDFDALKGELKTNGVFYADQIAYFENSPEPIDIRALISYLYVFDVDHIKEPGLATRAYVSKAGCLDHHRDNHDHFMGMYDIADDIFQLWDQIHFLFPGLYKWGKEGSGQGASFGKLTGITPLKNPAPLYFIGKTTEYGIPDAYKYPILAAFRAFVRKDQAGKYYWDTGSGNLPLEELRGELGVELVRMVTDAIKETRSPNRVGKMTPLYQNCYLRAENYFLRAKAAGR